VVVLGLGASFYVTLEVTVAPAVSRLHGFAVRNPTLGVRVAVRLRWDTEVGTPVPGTCRI